MFASARQGVVVAAALVLAAAASAACGESEPPGGIVWRIGLYQGFKQACREKKPLVVFIYQDKCPSCDKMMASLTDQRLGAVADRADVHLAGCRPGRHEGQRGQADQGFGDRSRARRRGA